MDAKLKHLEFIQGVVNRLASASFQMKGWSVVLVSALLVLLAGSSRQGFTDFFVLSIPILMFWALDGYFLSQERRFRCLYDHVRQLKECEIDFSMTDPADTGSLGGPVGRWFGATFSFTLLVFHGGLALLALAVARSLGSGP